MNTKNKVVYFLGAGFSKDAGGPIQNEILTNLLSTEFEDWINGDEGTKEALADLKRYLSEALHISNNEYNDIALEDVFTPIDKCIAEGHSIDRYSYQDLIKLHDKLQLLIAKSIQFGVDSKGRADYINKFAHYINSQAKSRLTEFYSDNIAIITTNWDILLDNALFEITSEETNRICNGDVRTGPIAVVDYCCHISSIESNNYIKPGLFALGRGGYCIKYLKLHGSLNWLHCPYCQRLYIKFGDKIIFEDKWCKHCRRNLQLKSRPNSIKLRGNLLLPTFLKDLKDTQMRLVWQNAGIELSEAKKVVFIGYSLPQADFEIRQLLSRFISPTATIELVLYPTAHLDEEHRYRSFFGNRVTTIRATVPEYVDSLVL